LFKALSIILCQFRCFFDLLLTFLDYFYF